LVITWLALAVLSATSLALAALPARLWGRLFTATWPALAAGTAAGGLGWVAGFWTEELWGPLGRATFWAVNWLVGLVCPGAYCDPPQMIIGTPAFAVQIAPECSGYEGIGLTVAVVGCCLGLFRKSFRFPHALLILPLGAAIAWLANVGRLAALVLIGSYWSEDVAAGGFHSQAGWLVFNAVTIGLLLLGHRLPYFLANSPQASAAASASPAAAFLLPVLVLIAVGMATSAASDGFDPLYPVRVAATAIVLWAYRRHYPSFSWSWPAVMIGAAVAGVWLWLAPAGPHQGPPTVLADWPTAGSAAWIAIRILGSVVVVPLAEELAFRGYLARRLINSRFHCVPTGTFTWVSFLGSSALFGAAHGPAWLPGILAGLAYGLALYRRQQLSDAVLAHATTNALLAAIALATGDWSVWT
jgi:exosortase E/protease (VPEID-CTERM system)